MGMLRLRFVGNRKVDPAAADVRYAILIERARDHAFLNFDGWKAGATPKDPPQPPAGWGPGFGKPGKAYLELLMMRDFTPIPQLLDEVYWLDLDVTNFPDDDYYVYFYSLTDGEMQYALLAPIVAGDDMSLSVRLRKQPILFSFNGNFTGLPGATGKVSVSGTSNLAIGLPKPAAAP